MVVHLSIISCPGNMVQLALYNSTNVINGEIFHRIPFKLLLVVSVPEAEEVVEVNALAEDPELECYRPTLSFFSTLME